MYKGTTPIFVFTFDPEFDPSLAQSIIVTFSSNKKNAIFERTEDDIEIDPETKSIAVWLSQAETLSLPAGHVYCQINFTFEDGNRMATDVVAIDLDSNLHNKVIE